MPAMNVNYYNCQKCWRQFLPIRKSINAGDKCYQLENPEMLAIYVSNYEFQNGWRQMLPIRKSRNVGDKC